MDTVERIFALIEEKGVTAAEVGKDIGIPKSSFTDWKKGRSKPSTESVAKLAVYFGVTADYLLGLSDDPDPIVTIAAHSDKDLPPEAQKQIREYAELIRMKLRQEKNGK